MALLGFALLLWILPTDGCKCNTTAGYCTNVDNVLQPVYSNVTTSATAGRMPVPITTSLSKHAMNMTKTFQQTSQRISGAVPHTTRMTEETVVPESVIAVPPQVPLSCLRPDVTCTLKTTMTKIIATETVLGALPTETSQNMETGTLEEGGPTYTTDNVDTTASSSASTGHGGIGTDGLVEDDSTTGKAYGAGSVESRASITCTAAFASTTSREKPVFSYDPINISTRATETDDLATLKPTASASLNALSVLESALSALTDIAYPSTTAQGASSVNTAQGSQSIYLPLPTEASDRLSHTNEEQHGKATSGVTKSGLATQSSASVTTITTPAMSLTSSNEEQAPHFTFNPTSDERLPETESMRSTTDYTSQTRAPLTYSPIEWPSTILSPLASSPMRTTFVHGSLTLTTGAVGTLSQPVSVGGTTLSAGGAPVTLSQGEVLSYATDGLVVAKPSGYVQTMNTVTAPLQTGRGTSGDLPEVVQQPAPSDSSSETTRVVDAASTDYGDDESDFSNGSKRLARTNGVTTGVIVIIAFAMYVT